VFVSKKNKRWWHLLLRLEKKHWKGLFLCIVSLVLIFGGLIVVWISTLKIPDLSSFETRQISQSTKIYDRTGTVLLYDVNAGSKRTVVPLSAISPYIQKATIAIEDVNFYNHGGIDVKSIFRAVLANLTHGGVKEGASTITQQVIKNAVLTSSQTFARKIEEAILAIKLEHVLTKDQILEAYLNEAPYGGNIYGIEEASETFFGVSASSTDIAQSAYLAAVLQAPTYYSPHGSNRNALDTRQHLVLEKMKAAGFITNDQYSRALVENVTFLEKNLMGLRAPHFVMYVINELINQYGEDRVENGGLKVTTTLDYNIQSKAEGVISKFAPTLQSNFDASNTAMVAIDPKTGDILSMVGSSNYFDNSINGSFNVATAERQPGSTFKPFVYATAFEKGFTPDTELWDVPIQFSPQCSPLGTTTNPTASSTKICYSPVEYDNMYEGPITARYALPQSRNIPAVEMLYMAGIQDSIATAEAMGLTTLTDTSNYGLSLVLGGGDVTLLDLTSAYSVFANDGVRNPYRSILEVDDGQGNTLEQASVNPVQVIPAQQARQINDILSDTKNRMVSIQALTAPLNRQLAIKTGTTNNYRDVWTLGYTPDISVGFWAGNNNNTPMNDAISTLIITPVWAAFMTEINDSLPKNNFVAPDPEPTNLKPTLRGIWQGGVSYFIDTISGKVATQYTPAQTTKEVVFPSVHNPLQWIDKSNPEGPIPTDPQNDPQYDNWEYAVRSWFANYETTHPDFKETSIFSVPSSTDSVHVPANFPHVSIISPLAGANIDPNSRTAVSISMSGPYPIQKADLYINGNYITSSTVAPFIMSFTPADISGIQQTNYLMVSVEDSVFDQGSATTTFTTGKPTNNNQGSSTSQL
jgi:penicillin-binding protein 1C